MTSRDFQVIGSALLMAVTFGAYSGVLWNDLVSYDDNVYVTYNSYTAAGLSTDGLVYAFTTRETGNWFPLTWLSWQLDATLFGMRPSGFHMTNMVLHAVNVVLLFIWLVHVTGSRWRSLAVAGIFCLHPLHVESVAWVSERKDVLSTFWLLISLHAYERYAAKLSRAWYLATCFTFVLGLLSKSMLVTFPLLLVLVDVWPLERSSVWKLRHQSAGRYPSQTTYRLIVEKIPLLVLSLLSGVTTIIVARQSSVFTQLKEQPLLRRLTNALHSYSWYIAKTFVPTDLIVMYHFPTNGLPWGEVAVSTVIVAGISTYVFVNGLRRPYLLFGWFWFLTSLLPVIGLLQVGSQSHADRYSYIPHIGLLTLIVWEVHFWASHSRAGRTVSVALTVAAAVSLGCLTASQVAVWRTTESLWKHVISIDEENVIAHAALANIDLESGHFEEAEKHFECFWKQYPEYRKSNQKLVAIYRRYFENPSDETWFQNELGLYAIRHRGTEIARYHFARAVAISPDNVVVRTNLATALARIGRNREARSHLEIVLSQKPNDANAHLNLGGLLEKAGNFAEARHHFEAVLQGNSANHEAAARLQGINKRIAPR